MFQSTTYCEPSSARNFKVCLLFFQTTQIIQPFLPTYYQQETLGCEVNDSTRPKLRTFPRVRPIEAYDCNDSAES